MNSGAETIHKSPHHRLSSTTKAVPFESFAPRPDYLIAFRRLALFLTTAEGGFNIFRSAVERAACAGLEIEIRGEALEIAWEKHRCQHLADFDRDPLIHIKALFTESNALGT